MRQVRILTALVAALATLLLAFSSAPGADAQVASHTSARKLPQHKMTFNHKRVSRTAFNIYGKVSTYKGHTIYLQKGKSKSGPWSRYKVDKTTKAAGAYSFKRVTSWHRGTNWFRVMVPGNKWHRQTVRRFSITRY